MVLDWHSSLWLRLAGRFDKLPHALLLAGPQGVGKSRFARALAARLLCERPGPDGFACGQCAGCRWFQGGNHPDLRLLEPGGDEAAETADEAAEGAAAKKKSDQIVIEQVRGLEEFVNLGAHRHGYKVVLIRPAEAMNLAAANSLLKMLEEPASGVLFILISNNPMRLLPTIRSRCQVLSFAKPERAAAEQWLQAAGVARPGPLLARTGGVPLAAKAMAQQGLDDQWDAFLTDLAEAAATGSLAPAGRWEIRLKQDKGGAELDKATLVGWLQKWVYDLISIKLTGLARYHPEQAERLAPIAERASAANLVDCYNELLRVRAVARHPLNPRLFLEDLLARYLKGVAPGR